MTNHVNAEAFLRMYKDLDGGRMVSPRGQRIKECEDYQLVLDMSDSPCTSFEDRKFKLDYPRAEMRWYLRGDRYDRSIEEHATLWPKLIQPTGFYFSNYGYYVFGQRQIEWVIAELCRDKDSRRASIVLLQKEHMFVENKDVVCTYAIGFRIREDRLNMSVSMRSNDAVFGTTNDVFCFACVYRIVYAAMKFTNYPEIQPGRYTHKVDSLHVYERHWDMVKKILHRGMDGYDQVDVPYPSSVHDLSFLLNVHLLKPTRPPSDFLMSHFLWS